MSSVRALNVRVAIERAIVLVGLGLFVSFPCAARTFRFIDTTTGKPIVGVNAHLIARPDKPVW